MSNYLIIDWIMEVQSGLKERMYVNGLKQEIGKAMLPVLVEARPHSVKATDQLLEGSGPEPVWPSAGACQP